VDAKEVEVPEALAGVRIDRALRDLLPGISRTRLKDLIERGFVTLAGRPVTRAGAPVSAGDRIRVVLGEDPPPPPLPPPIRVLYEDEAVAVVYKPPGIAVHPNENCPEGTTVADALVARYGAGLPRLQGEDRPGIVHRLDRDTSGILVVARTEAAMGSLRAQFRARSVRKEYRAIVFGEPRFDADVIVDPIGRDERNPDRMAVARERGREAQTDYEVLERFGGFAHLRLIPHTGRTHQIRVHLAHLGHPVLGDPVYLTRAAAGRRIPQDAPPVERQFLHAHAIAFDHPARGERASFESPEAPDMATFLRWLRRR